MEQSLFFQYVQKYFPQLVVSIVEKLNDKTQNTLPYLYKNLLSTSFSVDGRWESLSGEYNRVAADVVAMDSPLPLKARDAMSRASGNIPKLGMELFLNEKQMADIDAMMAQNIDARTIVQKIFEDTPRVISGIYERLEYMFLQGLSTGVALADSGNVGTGVRLDYGYLDSHKFGVPVEWAGAVDSALAIDDIEKVVKKATEDGNRIVKAYADKYWFDNFCKNAQARQQFAFVQGFVGNNVPNLTNEQVSAVMQNKFGFSVELVDRAIKTEANGIKTVERPWAEGTIVFVCDNQVGNLVWTRSVEMSHPVAGVSYETADEYILVSKYRVNRPALREYTASQARVVPVIANPDRIYTLNIKTVQA
jgi:hypothetical protein